MVDRLKTIFPTPGKWSLSAHALPAIAWLAMVAPSMASEPPTAAILFCRDYPEHCEYEGLSPTTDASRAGEIAQINRAVNRSMRPAVDLETFGRLDHWNINGSAGDCEDYALTKRAKLAEIGIRADVAVGVTRSGERHAVAFVRLSDGTVMVLDNLAASGFMADRVSGSSLLEWRNVQ
jgi:predicted transglutaminase-like cysteine proteinase